MKNCPQCTLCSLPGANELNFAVVDKSSGRVISVHQHPDAAKRFIISCFRLDDDFEVVELDQKPNAPCEGRR